MRAVSMLALFFALLVSQAHAGYVNYSIGGTIEDQSKSTKTIFGGDADTFNTVGDGSAFSFNFKLNTTAKPSSKSWSGWTDNSYWIFEQFEFLVNGERKNPNIAEVMFSEVSATGWQRFGFDLFFNDDQIPGIDRIHFSLYGTGIFDGSLDRPAYLNEKATPARTAEGMDGKFVARVLTASSSVPEPSVILLVLIGCIGMLAVQRKKSALNVAPTGCTTPLA